MPQSDIIVVERLVKRYGARLAVRGVSFTVKEGEIIGLSGPGTLVSRSPLSGGPQGCLLRHRNETAWGNQAAHRMAPAQQRCETGNPVSCSNCYPSLAEISLEQRIGPA